jgi:glycosyltransferase involved in cell wall biosynthesis
VARWVEAPAEGVFRKEACVKLSIYTAVRDGLRNDYHIEAMLRHHLDFADEIVVNEGYSRDRTYEVVAKLHPKIRVFRSDWRMPNNIHWSLGFKEAARRECTGDWCIYLDADEFIPEWEFDKIREEISTTKEIILGATMINFYGNYRVFHEDPKRIGWPYRKMVIHQNRVDIEFWGDGSNVRLRGEEVLSDSVATQFTIHHFGMVRHAGVLREKWWIQGRKRAGRATWMKPPLAVFRALPHDWRDPHYLDGLREYDGPFIKAVRDNPDEFTRDGMRLVGVLGSASALR